MSRWVDAEWLRQNFNTVFWSQVTKTINSAPSIDIVRCKDCIYWTYDDLYDEHICGNSEWTGVGVKADDFCSRGEKKGDE